MKTSKERPSGPRKPKNPNVEYKVTQKTELMKFLEENLPHKNRNNIKTMLKKRQVLVNGVGIGQFNHPLKPGDKIEFSRRPSQNAAPIKGFVMVHEDRDLLVVNKNAGIYAVPTDKEKQNTVFNMLSTYLKGQGAGERVYTISHIDRETSGLIVFSKSKEVQEAMKQTEFVRSYLAVIEGKLDPERGEHSSYLSVGRNYITNSSQNEEEGRAAKTYYATQKTGESFSMVKLDPKTSFKNQVRVHLKDLGHSIVGDKKYGSKSNPIGRMCLHAAEIEFRHPVTKKVMHFKTSTPSSFLKLF